MLSGSTRFVGGKPAKFSEERLSSSTPQKKNNPPREVHHPKEGFKKNANERSSTLLSNREDIQLSFIG